MEGKEETKTPPKDADGMPTAPLDTSWGSLQG